MGKIELDLTTQQGMIELSHLLNIERGRLVATETHLRIQLEKLGIPLTIAQARHYAAMMLAVERNEDILIRLLRQAPYHNKHRK